MGDSELAVTERYGADAAPALTLVSPPSPTPSPGRESTMSTMSTMSGWSMTSVRESVEVRVSWGYLFMKRLVDLVAGLAALVAVAPLLAIVAVLIKIDSRGPVIFVQERVRARRVRTRHGWQWQLETFPLFKLRTMTTDASPELHVEYMAAYIDGDESKLTSFAAAEQEGTYKLTSDERVTRVGRLLRRTSLDELPQLFNVVRGEMSLVGPRPPIAYEVDKYDDWHFERFTGPGGITGWWQINGRCETSFEEMVRLDIEYLRRRSIGLDIKILLATIPTMMSQRGAG